MFARLTSKSSVGVRLAQPGEQEVAGAVERIQAAEAGGRVRGIPLLLGDVDDGDQLEPRIQPVAVQEHVGAVVDESSRADEGAAMP